MRTKQSPEEPKMTASPEQQDEPEEPPISMSELKVDANRQTYRPVTNIMVRAIDPDGKKVNCDLAHLERKSLLAWLSHDPERACRVVLVLLGQSLE